jgi:hypothetical protein
MPIYWQNIDLFNSDKLILNLAILPSKPDLSPRLQ